MRNDHSTVTNSGTACAAPAIRRRQRGATLMEALVAFLVLSVGLLTVARVQTHMRLHADVARQRAEAVRIAQEDMEALRAFSTLAASAGVRAYDDIATASRQVDSASGYATNTRYVVARQVDSASAPRLKNTSVSVSWTDRGGDAQQVLLHSVVSGTDPSHSGALAVPREASRATGAFGRAVPIPVGAKDLGNGSSVFKPVSQGAIALVFDNVSGHVTARCTGLNPATATAALTLADLAACPVAGSGPIGRLLSGTVRFTTASPPQPGQANEVPLALSLSVALSGGTYPQAPDCDAEAMKSVSYTTAGGTRRAAVPINATPAWLGLAGWVDTGERYVAYTCVVYPTASGAWSGRATVAASGWTIGTGSADRRVCRFTNDLDGSGAIDANIEHPAVYAGVAGPLANQNFLVIRGTETCPTAPALNIVGSAAGGVFAPLGTAPHQP